MYICIMHAVGPHLAKPSRPDCVCNTGFALSLNVALHTNYIHILPYTGKLVGEKIGKFGKS